MKSHFEDSIVRRVYAERSYVIRDDYRVDFPIRRAKYKTHGMMIHQREKGLKGSRECFAPDDFEKRNWWQRIPGAVGKSGIKKFIQIQIKF